MKQIEQIKADLQKRLLKYDPDMTNVGRELQEVLAFIDSLPAESCLSECIWGRTPSEESCRYCTAWCHLREPKVKVTTDCNFKEYLRGVFEANNGIENDPDLLVKLHASTLLELAQKELPDSPDFEAEWKRYTQSRKDDMQTNAVTMNVKEVAKHFAEWQKKQMMKGAVEGYIEGNWREQEDAPYELYATSDELDSTKYKIGDRVKLIILKEDD